MALPNDWRECRLAEVTLRPAMWNPQVDPRTTIEYVDVSAVSREELRILAASKYSGNEAPGRARKIVNEGDTIFATVRPTLRRIAQVPGALDGELASTAFCVLRPDRSQINPDFLFFATQTDTFMSGISALETGASYPAVRDSDVLDQFIPMPPIREQGDIAKALSLLRSVGLHERECESQAVNLKRTAIATLFRRGLKPVPEPDANNGGVPVGWSCTNLGAIAQISYGAQAAVANSTDPSTGTLILTNVNLDLEGHINLEKKRYYKIPEAYREKLLLRKGDVLFNWRSGSANHIGKTVYFDLDGEYTYSSFILRFRPHSDVSSKYLYWWLTHLRMDGFFTSQRNVSSINSVYNASLSATIPIWYPDEDQQVKVVEILDAIEHKVDLHRKKRTVLEDLFRALLHKLLTGEIRVSDFDLNVLAPKQPVVVNA